MSVSHRKLDIKAKQDSESDKKQPDRQNKDKCDGQRARKGSAGDLSCGKSPEESRNQNPPWEIRREKHKEERKKQRATEDAEVNHVTQSERHKWEQKRERMLEDLKSRRHREEVKKEEELEEVKEERPVTAQPGDRAPGDPQREKHADHLKPLFER